MKKRFSYVLLAALTSAGVLAAMAPVGASPARPSARPSTGASALANSAFFKQHGYLPIHGVKAYNDAKAYAAAWAAAQHPSAAPAASTAPAATIGSSWQGISSGCCTPPDANGAIGPSSYIEIINLSIAIYQRTGTLITSATLSTLTGHGSGSDPTVLWDPNTQRFYYNVWDVSQSTMQWGFSKDTNPTSIPSSFCNYTSSFGYNPSSDFPDYPKLGQSTKFLMIGVNHYPSLSSMHADRSDVLWITKPQGSGTVTTCPASSTFKAGKFTNLRNGDGTQAFTPVPAIQTDASINGLIVAMSDIECPDICGSGTLITSYILRPNPTDPTVPQMKTTGTSASVASFTSPADAPQKGTSIKVDTLDGRITHAVSGIDPTINATTVWVAHTVMGGAGSEVRWYEVRPTKTSTTLVQSGAATNATLWALNTAISNDRTCTLTQCAHGDAMVLGFTTTSTTTFPTDQFVSKIGTGAQSAFVLVHASTVANTSSRWGDYGGATSDPAASLTGAHGEVWLTNEWTSSGDKTWNWEVKL